MGGGKESLCDAHGSQCGGVHDSLLDDGALASPSDDNGRRGEAHDDPLSGSDHDAPHDFHPYVGCAAYDDDDAQFRYFPSHYYCIAFVSHSQIEADGVSLGSHPLTGKSKSETSDSFIEI